MQLSIIIVNYRVRFFLEQCLHSVMHAIKHVEAEVWVIDNNSGDGSIAYLQPLFSWVNFIELPENVGFAKANNLGLKQAKGEFILFLNPDTIVAEDAFTKSIACFQQQAQVGALGIKMLDGSGRFLKESKRGFPSPRTSFFKMTGLAALLPYSKTFARYYLGHLSNEKDAEVEVLAGAYMMLRKSLLDKIGGFDEIFFMYGEDIDLSYRVSQAGMKNFYLASSSIIHFKGESTRKGSLNYVRIFYQAMILFVNKHYQGTGAALYRFFLRIAIGFRAIFSALTYLLRSVGLPLVDCIITLFCLWAVMRGWYTYIKPGVVLEPAMKQVAFPVFSAMFLLSGSLSGLYDVWYKPRRVFSAAMTGVLAILAFYSMLPEQYRFSRGIILVAGLLATCLILLVRWVLIHYRLLNIEMHTKSFRQMAVAGTLHDYTEVEQLLQKSGSQGSLLGRLAINAESGSIIGKSSDLKEALQTARFRDLVFVLSSDFTVQQASAIMQQYPEMVHYKFCFRGSQSLVGSDNKQTTGEVIAAYSHYNLAKPNYRRAKRIFDLISSLCMILTMPIQIFVQPSFSKYLSNSIAVLAGRKTWIGYAYQQSTLPILSQGILTPNGMKIGSTEASQQLLMEAVDQRYAADYEWTMDMAILQKNIRKIGSNN